MSDKPQVKFDPVKLEQLRVAQDYPLEPDEFELLLRENAYCEMGHVNADLGPQPDRRGRLPDRL